MERRPGGRIAATIVRGVLTVVALAAVLVLVTLPRTDAAIATWPDAHPWLGPLDRAGGAGLVLAGIGAWWLLWPRSIGVGAMLAGLAWLAAGLVGTPTAPDVWRSAAWLVVPLLLPATAWLVVRAGSVGALDRRARRVLALLGAVVVLLSVARALTYLPADDPRCWTFCSPARNLLALGGDSWTGLQRGLTQVWGVVAVAGWAGLAAWSAIRLWPRRPSGRGVRVLLVAGVALGTTSALWAAVALWTQTDPPSPFDAPEPLVALWAGRVAGIVLLGLGVAAMTVVGVRRTRALRRVMTAMEAAPAPGALAATLAATLDDPTLTVSYALEQRQFVDATGATVPAPVARPGRALTTIERGGDAIAIVEHDATLDGPTLIREVGAAARLAVDNERLRASLLARVADLRASQARIVAVGDEERQRLERDLHDGAQQRLIALSYAIRVARQAAARDGAVAVADQLARAEAVAQVAMTELRRLAHGIFPAILRDTGLTPALSTLADDAVLPVELDLRYRGRCGEAAEVAAYQVVAGAVLQAARSGASHLAVRLDRVDGALLLDIDHDGGAGPDAGARVADRVGAVGGWVESGVAGTASRSGLRVVLPCG